MMNGKKFVSITLNIPLSLAFGQYFKFFIGPLLSGISCLKEKELTLLSVAFVKRFMKPKILMKLSLIFFFCDDVDLVKPHRSKIMNIFHLNTELDSQLSNFEKVFGIFNEKFLIHIIRCTKYFSYKCKFQDKKMILMV